MLSDFSTVSLHNNMHTWTCKYNVDAAKHNVDAAKHNVDAAKHNVNAVNTMEKRLCNHTKSHTWPMAAPHGHTITLSLSGVEHVVGNLVQILKELL